MDIYSITYFRNDTFYTTNGNIPGLRPVNLTVGCIAYVASGEPVEITQIDFDADLRRFMVSTSTKMILSIPYSDDIEVLYYDKEQHGRDIQDRDKEE